MYFVLLFHCCNSWIKLYKFIFVAKKEFSISKKCRMMCTNSRFVTETQKALIWFITNFSNAKQELRFRIHSLGCKSYLGKILTFWTGKSSPITKVLHVACKAMWCLQWMVALQIGGGGNWERMWWIYTQKVYIGICSLVLLCSINILVARAPQRINNMHDTLLQGNYGCRACQK